MTNQQLWLLAGGNGVGKSTFYREFLAPRGMPFINADLIARQLEPTRPESRSYQAARIAERLRSDLLRKGISFCFETVFSHPSKIDFLAEAKAWRYEVVLIYIHLRDDQLNQARVRQRVSEGGHDVPAEKIIRRIPRTMANIRRALPLADKVRLYDNSSASEPFRSLAVLEHGTLSGLAEPAPGWLRDMVRDFL